MPAPKTIDELAAAPYNPRTITEGAADGLREAMKRFGDISGITYNLRTKRLVCGHQRVAQLREAGAQMVKGALQLANGERFPVRVVDWTEAEEKAANVTANNPHIAGEFNADLDGLLRELQASMGDAEFESINLDALLDDLKQTDDTTGDQGDQGDDADLGTEQYLVYSKQQIADAAFSFFRARGHPSEDVPKYQQYQLLNKIARASALGRKLKAGGGMITGTYQRHRPECKVAGRRTLMEAFMSDDILRIAIELELDNNNGVVSRSLSSLAICRNTQACGDFDAVTAATLYRRFARPAGVVLDPCAGWGGRMLGWHASGVGGRYVACEPSTLTYAANKQMAQSLQIPGVELHCTPFEDFDDSDLHNACSLVLTSPPYFSKEQYADEQTQSWVRYTTVDDWLSGFLSPLAGKAASCAAPGAYVIINIDDVKIGGSTVPVPLVRHTIDLCVASGLSHVGNESLAMSKRAGANLDEHDASEPILIFQKGSARRG